MLRDTEKSGMKNRTRSGAKQRREEEMSLDGRDHLGSPEDKFGERMEMDQRSIGKTSKMAKETKEVVVNLLTDAKVHARLIDRLEDRVEKLEKSQLAMAAEDSNGQGFEGKGCVRYPNEGGQDEIIRRLEARMDNLERPTQKGLNEVRLAQTVFEERTRAEMRGFGVRIANVDLELAEVAMVVRGLEESPLSGAEEKGSL